MAGLSKMNIHLQPSLDMGSGNNVTSQRACPALRKFLGTLAALNFKSFQLSFWNFSFLLSSDLS